MMSWIRALFVVGVVLQLASPASACSGLPNCRKLASVQPSNGATGVPRNIELRVTYDGVPDGNASVVLQTEDGRDVPILWERAQTYPGVSSGRTASQLWVGRSATPLDASTHYRVRHSYSDCRPSDAGVPPSCDGLCLDAVGEVISEFTTGADVDEVVLAAPTIGPVTMDGVSDGERDSCGPYLRCLHTIEVPSLPSDQLLRVTRGETLIGYFASQGALTASVPFSGRFYPWEVSFQSESGEYRVSVVDAVGNRSPTSTFVLPACVIPDAGVPDAGPSGARPDASTPVDASTPRLDAAAAIDSGSPPSSDDDGCALGRSHPLGGLWLALAIVLARRRTR
ncbi:MAG: Ig-like domain-containing protein [Polyangiales bacterium]